MSQDRQKADASTHQAESSGNHAGSGADDPDHGRRPGLAHAASQEVAGLRCDGLERVLRRIDSCQRERVSIDGRSYLLLCSNNYLGLAAHPEIADAACHALRRYGSSAVSSRLISGHMQAHAQLEEQLAAWKGCERALLFPSGYQANIGVISTLVGPGDVVISDELNHASIIDGCRLSRAHIAVYRHNDVERLSELLAEHDGARRILVVTESIFSMDGDRAPLTEIVETTKRYGAWLMVDEAHAAGVFGPRGAGLVAELGLDQDVDVHMGTLGKALASSGAYVAGNKDLIELLINRARSFIFTTGLAPAAAAAAGAALTIIEREPQRAASLLARARRLGGLLREGGLEVPHLDSQILPVIIGEADAAVAVMRGLLERGIYVAAIRPPTVAAGTSRLRVSLMATHSDEDLVSAGQAICECVAAEL